MFSAVFFFPPISHALFACTVCVPGPGFLHLSRSIVPRLTSAGFTAEEVSRMVHETCTELLLWYTPQPVVDAPIETLTCHWCGAQFVPGEHYEKFANVYCKSLCLAAHRKIDFKQR